MPFIELVTNAELTKEQSKELALSLSAASAVILKKPESAFGINVRANEVLTFGGNFDPAFQLRITSLNNLQPEKNIGYSKVYAEWLKENLGVESDRGYITFYDPTDLNLGFKGTTYAEIRKGAQQANNGAK